MLVWHIENMWRGKVSIFKSFSSRRLWDKWKMYDIMVSHDFYRIIELLSGFSCRVFGLVIYIWSNFDQGSMWSPLYYFFCYNVPDRYLNKLRSFIRVVFKYVKILSCDNNILKTSEVNVETYCIKGLGPIKKIKAGGFPSKLCI